jgi:hypothetical protein
MTTTSGDRHGWSGIESWRDCALTNSQHFSQQFSQTSSRDAVEGSARSGNSQQHSQQHSQDYSQQHSQALVTALCMEGLGRASRLMIGLSAEAGAQETAQDFSSCECCCE